MTKYRLKAHRFYGGGFYAGEKGTSTIPDRDVDFEITIDLEALISDKGWRALGKSRETTVCDGAIVIKATKIT